MALYHGPDRLARFPTPSLLASYDVVVSTYDILTQDSKQSPVGPIFRVPWFRCTPPHRTLHIDRSPPVIPSCGLASSHFSQRLIYSRSEGKVRNGRNGVGLYELGQEKQQRSRRWFCCI